jgi:hypothetical protein
MATVLHPNAPDRRKLFILWRALQPSPNVVSQIGLTFSFIRFAKTAIRKRNMRDVSQRSVERHYGC